MAYKFGNSIITDGLYTYLDASNHRSYSGTGTTFYDISGNGLNFGIVGSPPYSVQTNTGYFGFSANQITQYLRYNIYPMPTSDITIEHWVRPKSNTLAMALSSYATSTTDSNEMLMFHLGAGNMNFYGPSNLAVNMANAVFPTISVWYHVVRTRFRTLGRETLYINGVQAGQVTGHQTNDFFTTNGSYVFGQEQDSVGGGFDPAQCWFGDLSILRIYDRELSSTEVEHNYNIQKHLFV